MIFARWRRAISARTERYPNLGSLKNRRPGRSAVDGAGSMLTELVSGWISLSPGMLKSSRRTKNSGYLRGPLGCFGVDCGLAVEKPFPPQSKITLIPACVYPTVVRGSDGCIASREALRPNSSRSPRASAFPSMKREKLRRHRSRAGFGPIELTLRYSGQPEVASKYTGALLRLPRDEFFNVFAPEPEQFSDSH
jgi:hypothetical protein